MFDEEQADAMPETVVLQFKHRIAHKYHKCDNCGEKIEPGQRYDYTVGTEDGLFFDWKMCWRCIDFIF